MLKASTIAETRLSLLIFNSSPEVLEFMDDFLDVFRRIGWVTDRVTPTIAFDPQRRRGVGVIVKSQDEHPVAADALIFAIRELGLKVAAAADAKLKPSEIRFAMSSSERNSK